MSPTTDKQRRINGDLLRRTRRAHATLNTMEKAAVAARLSLRSVQRAEKGVGSYETLEQLAAALGVSPWDYWIPLDGHAVGSGPQASTDGQSDVDAASIDERLDTLLARLDIEQREAWEREIAAKVNAILAAVNRIDRRIK